MFNSSKQFQPQQQMSFSPFNYSQQQFPYQYWQQQQQQYQSFQNSMMMNSLCNSFPSLPWSSSFMGNCNFMDSDRTYQQPQFNQMNNFSASSFPSCPSTSFKNGFDSPPSMPMMSPPHSSSGSVKEETARDIFFRTLSTSLKEANKFYCGKTSSTWKNPFLYKTTICENYASRSFCRFGVNCWYAHGPHELRCIPESDDLPDPTFITQYLSFLGLPSSTLNKIIENAYYVAKLLTTPESLSSSKKPISPIGSERSTSISPSPVIYDPFYDNTPATIDNEDDEMDTSQNKFFTSYTPNYGNGWAEFQAAVNGANANDDKDEETEDGNANPFDKSFHLFCDNLYSPKPW